MHEPLEPNPHAELLASYRRATEPDDEAVERALNRLLIRAEAEPESTPAPAPSLDRRAWWIAAALVLLALGGSSLLLAEGLWGAPAWRSEAEYQRIGEPPPREADPASPRPSNAGSEADTARAVILTAEPSEPESTEPESTEPESTEPESTEPTPKPRARRQVSEPEPPEPIAETFTPTSTSARDLADESRLLGKARRALAAGDFADAIDWAGEHARRHPEGLLAEERLMIEAVAWCRSGEHAEGRAHLAELERRYGATPTTAEIEATCVAD